MMKTDIHSTNIANLLVRLWHHISQRRRRQFMLLLGLMFMSVFAELISLGAVLPFLGVDTDAGARKTLSKPRY